MITSRMATITWLPGILPNPVNPVITVYSVYLNDFFVNSSTNTSAILSNLAPFTTYIVTVTASNVIGESNMSEPHTFTTLEEGNFYTLMLSKSLLVQQFYMLTCLIMYLVQIIM